MKKLLALVCAITGILAFGVTKDDYTKKFTVTVGAGVGEKTATDAVIPIFLDASVSGIVGFQYADFNESDLTDLYIEDDAGNVCSYEIDLVQTDGVTTIWVKVPSISAGTVLTVYYGGVENTDNDPTSVWSHFLGVWHFNEESSKGSHIDVLDASGHNLTGSDTTNTISVAGKFGLARQPRIDNKIGSGGVFLPAMTLGGQFAISGWFKANGNNYDTMFSTRALMADNGIWCGHWCNWDDGYISFSGDGQDGWKRVSYSGLMTYAAWNNYTFVADGTKLNHYLNGSAVSSGSYSGTVSDSINRIAVGNMSSDAAYDDMGVGQSNGSANSFKGQMDEVRIQSYANFNVDREYFESAISFNPALTEYSPAASCDGLAVDVTFNVISNFAPAKIEFTATVAGGNGNYTYNWDFDGDGNIDKSNGTSASEIWYCDDPGYHHVSVYVTDSASVAGQCTPVDQYLVNTVRYADSAEPAGGNGTEDAPFNNLTDLFSVVNDGDAVRIRGSFILGDLAAPLVIPASNISISPWDDNSKFALASAETKGATEALVKITGNHVSISNMNFSFTVAYAASIPIIKLSGNYASFDNCEFTLTDGPINQLNPAADWGLYKGVISENSADGMAVHNCIFSGFRGGNSNVYVLYIRDDADIVNCVFDGVSKVVRVANSGGKGENFRFVSNIVVNAENQIVDTENGGALFSGAWGYLLNAEMSFNRFINQGSQAGCLMLFTSKTGQNGIKFYNNTVVGYMDLAVIKGTDNGSWYFAFDNNLLLDVGCVLKDNDDARHYKTAAEIRNNYYSGGFIDCSYSLDDMGLKFTNNVQMVESPAFVTTNVSALANADMRNNFYRLKAGKKGKGWQYDAYVGPNAENPIYPEYIGAIEPRAKNPFVITIR